MKILAIDVGTGTQDILLYDSRLDLENSFKLILPSPTMIAHRRIKAATERGAPILLTGYQMGGGPSAWAAEAHARAGLQVYATPEAATTLNDDLEKVEAAGIRVVSEDEAASLPASVERVPFGDLELEAIRRAFAAFGVGLEDLDAIAVAVFDHGNAPPGVSDRQFRFDYLDRQIRAHNSLAAFAFRSEDIPPIMTRLRSVAESAGTLDCPLIVMDTAPAAVLGATFDPLVSGRGRKIIVNVGNFHTLAFRLGEGGIEGVFEHHTGEIDLPRLETLLRALADGSLRNEDVFNDMGHGALVYAQEPLQFGADEFDIAVTGPRRSMFAGRESRSENRHSSGEGPGELRPYFAVPFGDMMIAGCFGLLAATAEVLPEMGEEIRLSLGGKGRGRAPWEVVW
ncbi:MAG: DUF1786 domain-containing protein [Bacteroidota bacterium]